MNQAQASEGIYPWGAPGEMVDPHELERAQPGFATGPGPQPPPSEPPTAGFVGAAGPESVATSEERTLGAVLHVSSFAGWMIPLANIGAPLLLWLIKRDESPFLDHQGRQVLDFQITVTVMTLVSMVLAFVLVGIPMLIAVAVLDVVLTIVAAVKAADGTAYRYPFSLRFFSH